MFKCLMVVGVVVALAGKADAIHRASVELTAGTFESSIAGKTALVKFYAPWCGHCKRLAPTWDELADAFATSNSIMIAGVDCTTDENRGLCQKNGIRGYPTLRAFTPDLPFGANYNGGRDLEALKRWAGMFSATEELGVPIRDLVAAKHAEARNGAAQLLGEGLDHPEDTGDWTPEQVQAWAKNHKFGDSVIAKLEQHQIDGDILLHIENHDIKDDLGVEDEHEINRMWQLLTALKVHNMEMGIESLSFWQQRALNRRNMDPMVLSFGFAPRTAMSYFALFPSHAQPADRVHCGYATCSLWEHWTGWLQWFFIPEYYLWDQSDTLMGGLPGMVPYSLILRMVLKVGVLLFVIVASILTAAGVDMPFGSASVDMALPRSSVDTADKGPADKSLGIFGKVYQRGGFLAVVALSFFLFEIVGFIFSFAYWHAYPYVPWVISDVIFYAGIYVLPVLSFIKTAFDLKKSKGTKKD